MKNIFALNKIFILMAIPFFTLSLQLTSSEVRAQENINFKDIENRVEKAYPDLEKLYFELHANPELSLLEEKTAERLSARLKALGFEVTSGVGKHGVVAVLKNGDGPTVLIRTDMDALPVVEETGAPYASKVKTQNSSGQEVGVMHACGHDIHMTSWVGVAGLLTQMKEKWKGTLVMIAQPAEEVGAGARAMLADGLFERFPRPDYCLAMHVGADLEAGKVAYLSGYAMANVDSVDITVRGIGGHGAYPHKTKDPVVIAAQMILAFQTIVSREIPPIDPAVITVGSIHGGAKHNVIPDEVKLQLTVRSYSDEVRSQLLSRIEEVAQGIARTAGVPEERAPIVQLKDEYTPATYNSPELADPTAEVFKKLLGAENVVLTKPTLGGEDFGLH